MKLGREPASFVRTTTCSKRGFPPRCGALDAGLAGGYEGAETFLPSVVLVTGFDIIFFWVARMIMMTLHFTGEVPFRKVYINAIVRDEDGPEDVEDRGNVLDPLDLVDGMSQDALVAKSTSN